MPQQQPGQGMPECCRAGCGKSMTCEGESAVGGRTRDITHHHVDTGPLLHRLGDVRACARYMAVGEGGMLHWACCNRIECVPRHDDSHLLTEVICAADLPQTDIKERRRGR